MMAGLYTQIKHRRVGLKTQITDGRARLHIQLKIKQPVHTQITEECLTTHTDKTQEANLTQR